MSCAFLNFIPMKQKDDNYRANKDELSVVHPATSSKKSSELYPLKAPQFFFDQNRFTYTCMFKGEVVSIHFDSYRNEIFFRGHNLRNMALNLEQRELLQHCQDLLFEKADGVFAEQFKLCLLKV